MNRKISTVLMAIVTAVSACSSSDLTDGADDRERALQEIAAAPGVFVGGDAPVERNAFAEGMKEQIASLREEGVGLASVGVTDSGERGFLIYDPALERGKLEPNWIVLTEQVDALTLSILEVQLAYLRSTRHGAFVVGVDDDNRLVDLEGNTITRGVGSASLAQDRTELESTGEQIRLPVVGLVERIRT